MPLFKSFLCSARKLKVNSVKVMELLCLWVLCQGERCSRGFHQLLFFSEKKKIKKKTKKNRSSISNQTEGKEENRKSEESFTASSSSLKVWSPAVLVSALLGLGTAAWAVPCWQLAWVGHWPYHYLLPPCRRQFRWYFHATNAASAKAVLFKESVIS